MQPVTIPKRLSQRGDLVVIPREEYEGLLHIQKEKIKKSSPKKKTSDFLKVSQREKGKHPAFYAKLDRDLKKAMEDYRAGKFFGPFNTVEESRKFLESRKTKITK
jgi:hypothetical protein